MSMQTWQELLISGQSAGPTLSNSVTPTSILPAHAKFTLPTNYFSVGKMLRILVVGQLSNIVTTPGTLTLDVRFGSTIVFNGGAMQFSTTAHTTLPFWCEILLTCRAVGSTANLIGQGFITSQALSLTAVADSTTSPATLLIPNTAPAVGNNFDSTTSQQIDVFGTFSIANAGNAITVQQFSVGSLN